VSREKASSAQRILDAVRSALDGGRSVEIEGLGVFRKSRGSYLFDAPARPRVFVAYAVEDLMLARRLCRALEREGCSPWLDKNKLLPGQNWPRAIERAIEVSDAFVACFSPRSIVKRGQFQSELRYALDCARRLPLEHSFVIPVRLEPCAVPRRIAEQIQYVDLFPHWDRGMKKLLRAVARTGRGKPIVSLCA
jgi:hypothetical protein